MGSVLFDELTSHSGQKLIQAGHFFAANKTSLVLNENLLYFATDICFWGQKYHFETTSLLA